MKAIYYSPRHSLAKNVKASLPFYLLFFLFLVFAGCSKEKNEKPSPVKPIITNRLSGITGKNVMMEGFYWNVPMGGTWWSTVQGKISEWASAGITSVWLPPIYKGASGGYSCGYDPVDYFDFGDYNQESTTLTRYGNKEGLQAVISAAHTAGLQVYADIVMNHNGDGAAQYNPNTGTTTNTLYTPASGIFPRSYNDFHPSTYETSDAGVYGTYPDLCHKNPDVSGGLWSNSNSVAKYFKNTLGFDGWRFDWVDGYSPAYVADFVAAASGFAVTEFWGASNGTSVSQIQTCINGSGVSSFDFPCMFAMDNAFTNSNLALLSSTDMLCKDNPSKAVTFVTNHDVDDIPDANKLQAYAFIMAHEGTPCVFYTDYESLLNKTAMNTLIWINKNLASGTTSVLYSDNDEYVAQMNGSPGLLIYINNSSSSLTRTVTTKWANADLHDFSNNSTNDIYTNASGVTTINAPANSYTIWSSNGTSVTVTLKMQENVLSGNSLFFSGNNSSLTNWSSGVQGTWTTNNYWTCTVSVPPTELDFKVLKGTTGGTGTTWESGSNHVISSPVNGTTYTVTFQGGF